MKRFLILAAALDLLARGPAALGQTPSPRENQPPPPMEESKSELATVFGTVSAFEPGKSITILRPDKTTATYAINAESEIPGGLTTGKTVTVETAAVTGRSSPVVRKVHYKKVAKRAIKS